MTSHPTHHRRDTGWQGCPSLLTTAACTALLCAPAIVGTGIVDPHHVMPLDPAPALLPAPSTWLSCVISSHDLTQSHVSNAYLPANTLANSDNTRPLRKWCCRNSGVRMAMDSMLGTPLSYVLLVGDGGSSDGSSGRFSAI